MRTPESLATLVDSGIIQEVLRPLMSGKEAQVYVVVAGGEECVAKVYKETSQRTFKHRSEYTEGRRSRNTRDQRAVSKRTRHGRKQDEAAWRNTEVDMIYRLRDAGVRVPEPIHFVDGVLVMELVDDAHNHPAPRLGDLDFEPSEAEEIYQQLIREVVRMLCAGVIHGDLSDFNVLMSANGPVLIDFPQAVDPAHNRNARKLLLRDVDNLHRFVERYAPKRSTLPFAEEMWGLYETNRLTPDTELRGDYCAPVSITDTEEVLALIDDASRDEQRRRAARSGETEPARRPMRAVVDFTNKTRSRSNAQKPAVAQRTMQAKEHLGRAPAQKASAGKSTAQGASDPQKRRRRRRRKNSAGPRARSETGPASPDRPTGRGGTATRAALTEPARTQRTANQETVAPGGPAASKRRRRRRPSRTKGSQHPS